MRLHLYHFTGTAAEYYHAVLPGAFTIIISMASVCHCVTHCCILYLKIPGNVTIYRNCSFSFSLPFFSPFTELSWRPVHRCSLNLEWLLQLLVMFLDTDFCFRFSGFAVFFTVTNQGFELLSTYHLFSFDYSFTVKICLCVVLLGNMLDWIIKLFGCYQYLFPNTGIVNVVIT